MNDEELERQFSALRPAPPRPDLLRRLRQAQPAPRGTALAWPGWLLRAALPLAAAVAAALWIGFDRTPSKASLDAASPFESVEAEDYILGTEPLGIGRDERGRPYRILRGYGVRREVWRNPENGSEVARVVPRQHLLLARMDVY
jgi:hypothetical protein